MDTGASAHEYILGRNAAAAARLNLQHFLWTGEDGFLLHPVISLDGKQGTCVADIGTGTGIFLTELSKSAPDATLDGFDINISQAPPKQWLPRNVSMSELDILEEIPKELLGRYDVVHIRLFMCVIGGNDPEPVIRNLFKLLKPGGWLQWGEFDLLTRTPMTADPHSTTRELEEAMRFHFQDSTDSRMTPRWVPKLGELLVKNGMELVVAQANRFSDTTMAFNHDSTVMVWEEMRRNMNPASAARFGELLQNAEQARAQAKGGIVLNFDRWTYVARKPSA